MPELDPTDVYPLRNLQPPAEPWGRRIEDVQKSHTRAINANAKSIQAANRSQSASFEQLSAQLKALPIIDSDSMSTSGFSLVGVMTVTSGFDIPNPGFTEEAVIQTTVFANAIRTTTPTTARVRGYIRFEVPGSGFTQTPSIIAPNVDTQHTLNMSGSARFSDLDQIAWGEAPTYFEPIVAATAYLFSDSTTAFGSDFDNYLSISSTITFKNRTQ